MCGLPLTFHIHIIPQKCIHQNTPAYLLLSYFLDSCVIKSFCCPSLLPHFSVCSPLKTWPSVLFCPGLCWMAGSWWVSLWSFLCVHLAVGTAVCPGWFWHARVRSRVKPHVTLFWPSVLLWWPGYRRDDRPESVLIAWLWRREAVVDLVLQGNGWKHGFCCSCNPWSWWSINGHVSV